MLKPKLVKLINEELNIKNEQPFLINGYTTPYRLKKDGTVERFIGQTWGASSYSIFDIITCIDGKMVTIYDGTLTEYKVVGKK